MPKAAAPRDQRIKVLFLSANPVTMSALGLARELRQIEEKIGTSKRGDSIEFIVKWAVRPDDLQQVLLDVEPHIVHFSGHGSEKEGLYFESPEGISAPVDKESLVELLRILKGNIRFVMLNACQTHTLAEAITAHIDYAIGARADIGDEAAIEFSAAFYRAIGFGTSVSVAFDLGRNALQLQKIPEDRMPVLYWRTGIDPEKDTSPSEPVHVIDPGKSSSSSKTRGIHVDIRGAIALPPPPSPPGTAATRSEATRRSPKKVLWVDDDRFALESMSFWLTDRCYEVIPARTPTEALRVLQSDHHGIGCAIIDLYLPGASSPIEPSGLRLARTIKREWPGIPLVCLSNVVSTPAVEWFGAYGVGYFHKHELDASMRLFMRTIDEAMTGQRPPPSTLLVHGRAEGLVAEVKDYLAGELGWTDIRVLKEIASRRRSVAQKFSDESRDADLVLVLLSPEDVTFASPDQVGNQQGQADLVFELGYFLGSLKRRSCKVVVVTMPGAMLPLVVEGVAVLDAGAGLRSVKERLRLELMEWIG